MQADFLWGPDIIKVGGLGEIGGALSCLDNGSCYAFDTPIAAGRIFP